MSTPPDPSIPASTGASAHPPQLREPANLVSPRAKLFWAVRAGLIWLGLVAMQVVLLAVPGSSGHRQINAIVLAVTLVGAAGHLLIMPRWRYRVHRWEVTGSACYAQDGWITQRRRIAPLSRIQTVDTERGPIERLFRLASVTVTTASAAGPISIKGLDRDVARSVVDELTVVTASSSGDAT